VSRFETIQLDQVARDRVRVSGTKGEPPPPTLKVAMNEWGGFRNDVNVALVGLDIEEKAKLIEDAFWVACPYKPDDFASVTTRLVRTDKVDPQSNEEAAAMWRLTLKDSDERKVGRAIFDALVELGLSTIPGFFAYGGGATSGQPYGVYRPALIPADLVPQHVVMLGGDQTVVESVAPAQYGGRPTFDGSPTAPQAGWAETTRAPIGRVVGTRSGDKGGNANLGVFARTEAAFEWLDWFLTVDTVRELLPETASLAIDRYRLPNILSLNFLVHGLLQEGVAASTRQDGQAKSLGEWLRSRWVDIPTSLLPA
jgi:hypothetical protein